MFFTGKSLQRQIRISGNVIQVSEKEADDYFNSRPYESRIGAWVSDQSRVMKERVELLKKIEEFKKKYKDEKNLPRPKHWSGWCLNPSSIEFWLGDEYRINERLRYKKGFKYLEKKKFYILKKIFLDYKKSNFVKIVFFFRRSKTYLRRCKKY